MINVNYDTRLYSTIENRPSPVVSDSITRAVAT